MAFLLIIAASYVFGWCAEPALSEWNRKRLAAARAEKEKG